MHTNNLFASKATETTLHIFTARDSEVATLYQEAAVVHTMRLRPTELHWLAYAAENFAQLHAVALAAGPQQKHPLTILPDPETV
jgi:hypothetical protein